MTIAGSVLELIGKTPLVNLARIAQTMPSCKAEVIIKLEYCNPGFSIKDRLALAMVDDAEKQGFLVPHSTPPSVMIEPSSGNTGIALAMIAAIRGYHLILTMPENMSDERKKMLQTLGANVVLTPAREGMAGSLEKALELVAETPNSTMLQQFSNPVGPHIHCVTTAEEIWADCAGKIDIIVSGIGTGSTITGVARGLRKYNPNLLVYGVEPDESAVLSGEERGSHEIQGIGAGFIPEVLDTKELDGVIRVKSRVAIAMSKRLIKEEGVLAGISTGAAAHAAFSLAIQDKYANKRILFFAYDAAERYLSTSLFS